MHSHARVCKTSWEYFAANDTLPTKSSDRCQSNHVHVCEDDLLTRAHAGMRTRQVSRKLLNALKFKAPRNGRLRAMPVSTPKGPINRAVVDLSDTGIGFAGPKDAKGCARISCKEPVGTCTHEDELVNQLRKACRNDLRTHTHLCCSRRRFCDQVLGLEAGRALHGA